MLCIAFGLPGMPFGSARLLHPFTLLWPKSHLMLLCRVGTPMVIVFLLMLLIPPLFRHVKEIVPVVWKAPTITWVKANTDGSVVNLNASCGGIFRDFRGTFLGCFASNIGSWSVFEAELMGLILAMEFAARNHWNRLWLECDSSSVVHAFKNNIIIPIRLRNRRHNCFQHGMTIICSHVFREGNCCADKLASLCHVVTNTIWYTTMPSSLADDFTRDRNGPCA